MKIVLTGGGAGGHFYPLIAVAEEINDIVKREKLLPVELFYLSDSPHDETALLENNIEFVKVSAGKARRYFSLLNIFDLFKTFFGLIGGMITVFRIYPDVVFSKGAYASFPVLFAARFFRIPVVVHESDSVPGRTNAWAGKFAKRIAVSYADAAKFFDAKKTAVTGNPVRRDIRKAPERGIARDFFGFKEDIPVVVILGGSLGAVKINDQVLSILPKLVETSYIIHQTGKNNLKEVAETANVVLGNSRFKDRYRAFDYLDNLHLSMAAGAADLVVSRAGSAIFEIASWGVPSVIIPIADTNGDHQRMNAYSYARSGGASVIEEANLTPNILLAEITRILSDKTLSKKMAEGARSFISGDAAEIIAREILSLGLKHEDE